MEELNRDCTKDLFARVVSINSEGIVLETNEGIFDLDHEGYPWFIKAKVSDVLNVRRDFDSISWENLGVDLEIDSILHPEKYPYITHL